MFTDFTAVFVGLGLLVWGSDRFVLGASAAARNFGVSTLIIGLTVVGVGTSAPELLISTIASLSGNPALAIGNAVGSNIANVGLVIGVAALVAPLTVRSQTLKQEFPLMLGIVVLAWVLLSDGDLGHLDGVILMTGFIVILGLMIGIALKARRSDPLEGEFEEEIPSTIKTGKAIFWVVIGLAVLLASSRLIVWGASNIAQALGVSDLLIGLTIVAVGTSLPELAASVTGVLKGEPDIAIGNVIGSNMFNLLPVLSIPGLLAPGELPPEVMQRDFPIMAAFSVVFLVVAYGFRKPGRVSRWEGGLLLLGFCGYQFLLYVSSVQST